MTIKDASAIHIPIIQDIAERTWWPTYSPIVEKEQIRFMLDRIYSHETLSKVINDQSQQFILLYDEKGAQGFAAYGERPEEPGIFKLHKIYVLPETHGKGYGKMLLNEVIDRITSQGSKTLDLNVNRYNSARNFYERMGFRVIREENVPVGPYFMNDFVMRLDLKR
jgi:diamine N-acetyltransferase